MPLILPLLTHGYSAAAGGLSRTYVDSGQLTLNAVTSGTLSSQTLGVGEIWVFVCYNNGSETLNGVTVNGVSATLATDGVQSAIATEVSVHMRVYYASCSVSTGDIVLSFSAATSNWPATADVFWYLVNGRTSIDDVEKSDVASSVSPVINNLDVTTEANGIILAGAYGERNGSVYTWTGVTEDHTIFRSGGNPVRASVASAINQTAGAKTVEASATISSLTARRTGVSVAIS